VEKLFLKSIKLNKYLNFKIIELLILGFFIYLIDKEIRRKDLFDIKMMDLTLNDLLLAFMGFAFVIAFLGLLLSLF
jgi:Na+-transporting methylmalonyl-CoA/oxaloacetate decarboxylase gamma subunit